eukprot:FR735158.1.p1 GENE.FR735158.1~~FR735158.1.p1  ORF type:complete len:185 (-),score=29.52 FR735158.1:108-662(-)
MAMITPSAQITLIKGNKRWRSPAVGGRSRTSGSLGLGPGLSLHCGRFFFFFFFFFSLARIYYKLLVSGALLDSSAEIGGQYPIPHFPPIEEHHPRPISSSLSIEKLDSLRVRSGTLKQGGFPLLFQDLYRSSKQPGVHGMEWSTSCVVTAMQLEDCANVANHSVCSHMPYQLVRYIRHSLPHDS